MAHGWSQVDLGKRLNLAKQTISNWENENVQPSVEMLVRIAREFHVSTDYLLGLEDTPRLDVTGLPLEMVAHLAQLIDDYQKK